MEYKEVLEEITRRAKTIGNCLHGYAVQVIHEEGTHLHFDSANAEKFGEWWLIYTEHHGNFVYHDSEVSVITYKRIWDNEKLVKER